MSPGTTMSFRRCLRPREWPGLAGLVVLVLLAHAGLLVGLPGGLPAHGQGVAAPMRVRQIERTAAPEAVEAAAMPPATPPRRRPRRASVEAPPPASPEASADRSRPDAAPDPSAPVAVEAPVPSEPAVAAADPGPTEPAEPAAQSQSQSQSQSPPAAPASPDLPPVYPTRLPPPAVIDYELRRGLLTGEGQLHWRPGPDGYELQIEGRALGMAVLGWASRGGFDAAGLAPQRFVDRRRGRDLRAANFQRDKGVISWSSSTSEQPLLPGGQDRLSWMVQLAAIVDADPARFEPGERVVMQVAGARGDVDLWAFGVVGREPAALAVGQVEGTLKLRREPRKPFDTVVEVWLDPARSHLPVRLKLATAGGDDTMEFRLKP